MDLSKYDSDYLSEGTYQLTVKSFRLFQTNAQNKGVEFVLVDDHGASTKAGFYLTNKAMYRLTSFARACGVEDLVNYEHDQLVGAQVMCRVVLDGKYHQVDTDGMGWWRVGSEAPKTSTRPPQKAPQNAPATAETNEIPF
jgi:hypothetical protein